MPSDLAGEAQTPDLDYEIETDEDDIGDNEMVPAFEEGEIEADASVEAIPEFYANLADGVVDDRVLTDLALILVELTDADKKAHEKRIARYKEEMARTGLDGDPSGGADFEGSSKVVHPMIVESCIDFEASAIRELFPVGGPDGGPVKHQVIGKSTQAKLDRAYRKSCLMNWQLTKQMPSFRDTLEELLTQLPMAGREYMKLYWNGARNRPEELFVPMHEIWLPASASGFSSAKRYTHAQLVDKQTMDERIESGMYLDLELGEPSAPEVSEGADAVHKIDGKETSTQNEDGVRLIREIAVMVDLEGDTVAGGKVSPYLVTIDEDSGRILSVYRNWDAEDPYREALRHIVEWGFIPWAGGSIGLTHLISGLSIAATGALRALLDSAHIANMQSAVKLKSGTGGQNVEVVQGGITEIEGANLQDPDIRKTIMPLPFSQPSPVLFQLLGFLSEAGKGVVSVALEKLTEAKADMPVGTTLALIEQGAKIYAAIHSRLHRSFERTLAVLHQLNKMHLNEEELKREAGELLARKADFQGAVDVCPVSDPNIFSETQRFAQVQAVAARAMQNPLYDQRKVEELILDRLKLPDGKDLLVPKPEAKRLNPVNENVTAAMGQPVVVFPDQDHMAHLTTHFEFLLNPVYGQNPLIQTILLPILLPHIKDHIVYAYAASVAEAATSYAGMDITSLMDDDNDVSNEMDRLLADASTIYLEDAQELFEQVMPPPAPPPMPGDKPEAPSAMLAMLGQMNQLMQSLLPPPPQDPAAVAAQDVQRKGAADQAKSATDQGKLQIEAKKVAAAERKNDIAEQAVQIDAEQEFRLQQHKSDAELNIHGMDNTVKERINTADNLTALTIADAEIKAGEKSDLSTGGGIDPGN